jgi:hypothetical protein
MGNVQLSVERASALPPSQILFIVIKFPLLACSWTSYLVIGEPLALGAIQLTTTLVLIALSGFTRAIPTWDGTLAASTDVTSEKSDQPCSF